MSLTKTILKKIFPRMFLKRAFLVYNQMKSRTLDKLFFAERIIPREAFLIYQEKNPFLELKIDLSPFDKTIRSKFANWADPSWKQDQYLLIYNASACIEPKTGWSVTPQRKLIYPSLGFSRAAHVHKPSWFETYIKKPKIVKLNHVISLRDTGEENYFHFFNDVLPKLFFLRENGIELKNYALIVAESLYSKNYFQYYLRNSFLSSLSWHVQQNEWIYFKSAIFCKPYTHTQPYFKQAEALLKISLGKTQDRKVFLTRSKNAMRHIQNGGEIIELVRNYGFEIIDAAEMTFENQVKLFRQVRHLIAVHGAGITNIIFRGFRPLSLLEIVPSMGYIPFHYIMLAQQFNFNYNVILGSEVSGDGSFGVNINDVKKHLEQLNVT